MYSLGKKVWILSSRKTDGRYNRGIVVGSEKSYGKLGYITEKQFFDSFEPSRYKVAYVDVVTGKACTDWVLCDEISHTKPVQPKE